MNKLLNYLLIAALVLGVSTTAFAQGARNQTWNVHIKNGAETNVESGASIDVESGGDITIESGGSLVVGSGSTFTITDGIPRSSLDQDDLAVLPIPTFGAKKVDLSAVNGTGGAAVFKLAAVDDAGGGEPIGLVGADAASGNITSLAYFQVSLPESYVAGETVQVRVYARTYTAGSPTYTARTVDVAGFAKYGTDETDISDLCATSAQTLTDSFAAYDFTITATTLTPGDLCYLILSTNVQESGGVACFAEVLKIELLCDVKG